MNLHQYLGAMLATQLNYMVSNDELDAKAIIRLDKYICNIIQETR
jgi:replication factor A1